MRTLFALLLALAVALPAAAQTTPPQTTPPPQGRQLFLFIFRPGPAWVAGRPLTQQDLRAHAAYHARLVREGRSVGGGRFVGVDGGMAIIRAADMAEAQAMLAVDPAIVNGVFAADLRHWEPRFHSPAPLVEGPR